MDLIWMWYGCDMELIRELNAGDFVAPKIPNPDERVGYPIDRLP